MSQFKANLAKMLDKDPKKIYFVFLTHTTKDLVTEEEQTLTNTIRKKRKQKNLFAVEINDEDFNTDTDKKLDIDIQLTKKSSNYFGQVTRKNTTFIRTIQFTKDMSTKQVYLKIFKFLRFFYDEFLPENEKENFLKLDDEAAFKQVFEEIEKKPFTVRLVTNTRGFQECYFCGDRKCDNCELSYNEDISLEKDILPKIKDNDFKLQFEVYLENLPDFIELSRFNACTDYAKNIKSSQEGIQEETKKDSEPTEISIYDCLSQFMVPEQLGEDNQWYCSKCKEFQKATKKMEIYKAPPILMLQLKRFKHANSLSSRSKIGDKIFFPLSELDLTDLVLNHELPMDYDLPSFEELVSTELNEDKMEIEMTKNNSNIIQVANDTPNTQNNEEINVKTPTSSVVTEDKKNSGKLLYDLFSVSNHYGSLGFGHYTAFCKNFKNDQWYSFDDSSVSREDPDNVCSTASYVLFYKRKDFNLSSI